MEKLSLLLEKTNVIKKILDFPSVKQSTVDNSGICAIQSVLAYYGENYREDQISNEIRISNNEMSDKTSVDNILNLFMNKDYKVESRSMNINELLYFINRDIPVILLIQAWGDMDDYSDEWKSGHYVVAIGYTRNKILFQDSTSFQLCYLTYEELMTRWHDQDEDRKYINYGIAVSGKNPKFDKNNWEKIG